MELDSVGKGETEKRNKTVDEHDRKEGLLLFFVVVVVVVVTDRKIACVNC